MQGARFWLCFAIAGGLTAALAAGSPAMAGPTLNVVTRFDYDPGAEPRAGVTVIGDRLYGVTTDGGILEENPYNEDGLGDLYSVPLTGGAYTSLGQFNGYTGLSPTYNLTAVGNTLYGASATGGYGPNGNGTIFSISTAPGGSLTNVATFHGQIGSPQGALTAVGNTLYGVASGGVYGQGEIYSIPTSGGGLHAVLDFKGVSNGVNPSGTLLAVGNTLYGVTSGAYGLGYGSVYSYNLSTNIYTTLGSFTGANGANPFQGLTLAGNRLYGATNAGGVNNDGTVFSVPLTGGVITSLASFGPNQGGASGLTLVGNLLYGTDTYANTIFSIPTSGGAIKTVATLNGVTGEEPYPEAGLTLVGNTLYGTASVNGSPNYGTAADPGYGTVFSLRPNADISVTKAAPTVFGGELGNLSVVSVNGAPQTGHASFAPTPTGFVALNDPNASHDLETFALHVRDSAPDSLAKDLADAVWELNSETYDGFRLTASTRGPHIDLLDAAGTPGGGYNLFITVRETAGGAGSPFFGFDFTQLIGTDNTLSVDELAVSATASVPEPATWAMMIVGFLGLGAMARRGRRMSKDAVT